MRMSLDELEQAAAEVQAARIAVLRATAQLAADAGQMGPGAVERVSAYFRWSPQHFSRMALLADLPDGLLFPDAPLGLYWAAAQAFEGPELKERLREALRDDWSVTRARREWGLTEPKEREKPVLECEATLCMWALADGEVAAGYVPADMPESPPTHIRLKAWEVKDE